MTLHTVREFTIVIGLQAGLKSFIAELGSVGTERFGDTGALTGRSDFWGNVPGVCSAVG